MKVIYAALLILVVRNTGYALVLCAASGGVQNQVTEGATVVVRSVCQSNETTLRPFTLSGPDLTEEIVRDKTIIVGRNVVSTVGGISDATVGGNESTTVGGSRIELVGGGKEIQIGGNHTETVGIDRTETVGRDETFVVGKNSTIQVSGNSQQITLKDHTLAAKKIVLTAADQITLKAGKAMIMMKKNGDISITGANIDIKGTGAATIKGSKINNN